MRSIILVGCGDHGRRILSPSLTRLEETGELEVVGLVDTQAAALRQLESTFPKARQFVRKTRQGLPELISELGTAAPVAILAHDHDWHARDAADLLQAGVSVVVEKPYAVSSDEVTVVKRMTRSYPERIVLAEYYAFMKAAPLFHAAGLLNGESFYYTRSGHLEGPQGNRLRPLAIPPLDSIGAIRLVYCDILEGEGETGRVDHRGRHFADSRAGIGMILDLGIHALAILTALRSRIGQFAADAVHSARAAQARQLVDHAARKFKVPSAYVPESYAETTLYSDRGVLAAVAVGKYILSDRNQRRLILVGDEGMGFLDMSSCAFSLAVGDGSLETICRSPKDASSKYVAVLRACLAILDNRSPFLFDPTESALRSNELCLRVLDLARIHGFASTGFETGSRPRDVFELGGTV